MQREEISYPIGIEGSGTVFLDCFFKVLPIHIGRNRSLRTSPPEALIVARHSARASTYQFCQAHRSSSGTSIF
jgi:hypothetical protein